VGKHDERNCFEGFSVDGKIIMHWVLKKQDVGVRSGCTWLRIDTVS
jgi:hypothetical protein